LDSLAKLAQELGVTTDYLITGKESVVSDIIPVIKADKTLNLEVKNALVRLVQAHKMRIALTEMIIHAISSVPSPLVLLL
jgi:hypothetical protein